MQSCSHTHARSNEHSHSHSLAPPHMPSHLLRRSQACACVHVCVHHVEQSGFWHGFVAWEQEGWNFGDFEWLSGLIYWAAMALLFLTALNIVRRKLFEFFYRM